MNYINNYIIIIDLELMLVVVGEEEFENFYCFKKK